MVPRTLDALLDNKERESKLLMLGTMHHALNPFAPSYDNLESDHDCHEHC